MQKIILVAVLYQLLLIIGDPILLGRIKLGNEVLDLLRLGAIFIGNGMDGEFILYHRN